MFERIVVGLDGSQVSETALRWAPTWRGGWAGRSIWCGSRTWRWCPGAPMRPPRLRRALQGNGSGEGKGQTVSGVVQPLRDEGLDVTTEVRSGLAARELADAADPDDLLVVASHGRHGLERLLLGSVAERSRSDRARRC